MNREWIEKQWQGAELGDKRLAKRAIKIGNACLETPDGSLPEKFGSWGNTKGAYRFFDSNGVSHEALQKVHNKNVIQTASTTQKNDIYDYVVGAADEGWDLVVRAKHDRTVVVDGKKARLKAWIRSLEPKGDYKLDLRARGEKFSRIAELKVSWGQALLQPPQGKAGKAISVTYVRAYDPEDEDLEWILVTTLKVDSVEDALTVVQIYEQRWIIEEYHKCLKQE